MKYISWADIAVIIGIAMLLIGIGYFSIPVAMGGVVITGAILLVVGTLAQIPEEARPHVDPKAAFRKKRK